MDRSVLVRPRWMRGALRRVAYPYYWLTAPLRPLPSALIIGTMKGGTSTLNAWLRHHPQVMFSAIKEVHYFNDHYDRGERWYRTYFPLWEQWLGGRCALEATPAYLYRSSVVMPRMHALVPDARLILLLRNPVARAISHYGHQVQRGVEHRPAAEALMSPDPPAKGKPNHYKRRGLYADQIEQVLGFYPREQLLNRSRRWKTWGAPGLPSPLRCANTCAASTASRISVCRRSCRNSRSGTTSPEAQRLRA